MSNTPLYFLLFHYACRLFLQLDRVSGKLYTIIFPRVCALLTILLLPSADLLGRDSLGLFDHKRERGLVSFLSSHNVSFLAYRSEGN
jgi:Na+-transporting methylmalonyl-CoA/oxaloacetate decarboxylase beta subunit